MPVVGTSSQQSQSTEEKSPMQAALEGAIGEWQVRTPSEEEMTTVVSQAYSALSHLPDAHQEVLTGLFGLSEQEAVSPEEFAYTISLRAYSEMAVGQTSTEPVTTEQVLERKADALRALQKGPEKKAG